MPFSSYAAPVYSLSLLKSCLRQDGIRGDVIYGNMLFRRFCGLNDYLLLNYEASQKLLAGEIAFTCAAYDLGEDVLEEYARRIYEEIPLLNPRFARSFLDALRRLQKRIPAFLQKLSEIILEKTPRIVAFSSMFYQNNACIALARYLKARRPELVILMGGANCTGDAGLALVRAVPWIDFVFSGEADECFAALCQLLLRHGIDAPDDLLPYGAFSKTLRFDGAAPVRYTKHLDAMPLPDYDDFFRSLKEYDLEDEVFPCLFVEFSRGCWWNAKKPCTFCGLNAKNNIYRIKSVERVLWELTLLRERYQIGRFSLTDNILSPIHIRELLPKLAREKEKFSFFAEVKSNLTADEVALLGKAGFRTLQPGIENLQDDILLEMNKGNRAIKHIELLKNAHNEGIYLIWHMLGGFPFEKEASYEELAALLPSLTHLQAPRQFIHILYNRDSAYVNHPEAYGLCLEPAGLYASVYPKGREFIKGIAFMYQPQDNASRKICAFLPCKSAAHRRVGEEIQKWQQHSSSYRDRLTYKMQDGAMEITDLRLASKRSLYVLTGIQKEICELCEQVRSRSAVEGKLRESYSAAEIERALDELKKARLIVEIRSEMLALAVREDSEPLLARTELPMGSYRIK